jgi:NDP-sugar pyrophosphorylase family protein
MKASLDQLKEQICTFKQPQDITDEQVRNFIENTVVALAVGGQGQRLQGVTKGEINKNALKVGERNETLVERIIKMYAAAGITQFVALVYNQAESIIEELGDGSALGVSITYSFDPEKPVGRGGAVLNAHLNGALPADKHMIVHNPDDQIVDYDHFVTDCVRGHLAGAATGHIGTAIVTTSTPYAYTGMKIEESEITEIEMYPEIPVPAHIGVTIFDRSIYPYFTEMFSLEEKMDFEKTLFPRLSTERKLYAFGVSHQQWIPVNDPKGLAQLEKRITQ